MSGLDPRSVRAVVLAAALGCALLARAGGNTQYRDPATPSHVITETWDDRMLPIRWVMSQDGLPGSGISNQTLARELTAAFDTWQALPTSRVTFEFGGETPVREQGLGGPLAAGVDGRNLVTFTDPDVTFPPGIAALAFTFSFAADTVITSANADLDGDGTPDIPTGTYPAGRIFDADLVFNSSEPWGIDEGTSAVDVRAVALHEVGHLIGLCHSAVRDAVMWPFIPRNAATARIPKADDVGWASFFYPSEPAYSATFGTIRGRVTSGLDGARILGAHVFTVDPASGATVVGSFSGDDGRYVIPGLPRGRYLVAIEPLDGDPVGLEPFRINDVIRPTFDTGFPEEFYDANESGVEADPHAGLAVNVAAAADVTGIDVVTNTLEVPGVSRVLEQGYNLLAYPVAVPAALGAFELLQALGDPAAVSAIDRFAPATSEFQRAEYVAGAPAGVNFLIQSGEAYVVHMLRQTVVAFAGAADCPALNLVRGLNLVGVPCAPAGYGAHRLLRDVGDPNEVESIARFDPVARRFARVAYGPDGTPAGDDFPIVNGEGYAVTMLADRAGVRVPAVGSVFPPVVTGLSPGRGVPGTLVLVLGSNFDAEPSRNRVTFNGVTAGVVFATPTTLTVTVPLAATSGPVRVAVDGRQSNAVEFVVESPAVPENPGGPTELVSGQTADGALAAEGEQDRYEFTALAGSLVTITAESVTPGLPDLALVLEDPFGAIAATDDDGGGASNPRINNLMVQHTGTHTIVVTSVPGTGAGAYRLSLTIATHAGPTQVSLLGGNFQSGAPGSTLPVPLAVWVTGPTGAPMAGVPVTFVAEGATVAPAGAGSVVLATNASGVVVVDTTLPNASGLYTITVTAAGAEPVAFTLGATSAGIGSIVTSGDQQDGVVDRVLAGPLQVVVIDTAGLPLAGALVAFEVVSGGGSLDRAGAQQTDAAGAARVQLRLGQRAAVPQVVAAFVPGLSVPLLFEARATADAPASVRAPRSSYVRLPTGASDLSALWVEVTDRFGNPVEGATVAYGAPPALEVHAGLGPGGQFFRDFRTNADGLHVAEVVATSVGEPTRPTIDEFGSTGTAGLASTYAITASVGAAAPVHFDVDVDMGPAIATEQQNPRASIGEPLPNPVRLRVFRWERIDANGNGDFRDDGFEGVVQKPVEGVALTFAVVREDGRKEAAFGYQPTRTSVPVAVTGASGSVGVGVTMGDVAGVSRLLATTFGIPVVWKRPNGSILDSKVFEGEVVEATNLVATGVVLTATIGDASSGMDFASVKLALNGQLVFDGAGPLRIPESFPEALVVVAAGRVQKVLDPAILAESSFANVTVEFHPARPRLLRVGAGINVFEVRQARDRIGNPQPSSYAVPFSFPLDP